MRTQKSVIKLFDDKKIRTQWDEKTRDWYYCVTDVVTYFKDNSDTDDYIKKLRKRDAMLSRIWDNIIVLLPMETPGGIQKSKFANTQGIIRILFSINSEKANSFKMWLAQMGAESVYKCKDKEFSMKSIFKQFPAPRQKKKN